MVFYYQEKKIQKIKTWEEYIMAFSIEKETCIACGACEGVCPVEAISAAEGKYEIDATTCIDCGACEGVCPVEAISQMS